MTIWVHEYVNEQTAGVKVGAYIVSIDRKTTVYRPQACEIAEKRVPRCL